MAQDNRNYFVARAEQELTAAINATDPSVAAIHKDLAVLMIARAGQTIEEDTVSTLEDVVVAAFGGGEGNFRQIPRSGPA